MKAKAVAVLVVIVLAGAAIALWLLERSHTRELDAVTARADTRVEEATQGARTAVRELTVDTARALATALADEVVGGMPLQERLAEIVKGKRIVAVLVLAPDGRVLGTTDLRYSGRVMTDGEAATALAADEPGLLPAGANPGILQAAAPISRAGEKEGVVWIQVDAGELAEPADDGS